MGSRWEWGPGEDDAKDRNCSAITGPPGDGQARGPIFPLRNSGQVCPFLILRFRDPSEGVFQPQVGAGVTKGLSPPTSLPQMQPEGEDGDLDTMFQLQRKEMLQHLLVMLSSAMVLSPQLAVSPGQESHQPWGPPEEG